MKRIFKVIIWVGAIEAVHFSVFTGLMFTFGLFAQSSVNSFTQLLKYGIVFFWTDWVGQCLLICLVAVAAFFVWDIVAEALALKKRKKELDQEVEAKVKARIPALRNELQANFDRQQAAHREWMESARDKMFRELKEVENEKRTLYAERGKVAEYRRELYALHEKAAVEKEKRAKVRQLIRMARNEIISENPQFGAAVRHMNKAEKV